MFEEGNNFAELSLFLACPWMAVLAPSIQAVAASSWAEISMDATHVADSAPLVKLADYHGFQLTFESGTGDPNISKLGRGAVAIV